MRASDMTSGDCHYTKISLIFPESLSYEYLVGQHQFMFYWYARLMLKVTIAQITLYVRDDTCGIRFDTIMSSMRIDAMKAEVHSRSQYTT